ncbi:MAG: F0F1 ATP synthase subunit gamma [Steroidobacteraceae bacterium]
MPRYAEVQAHVASMTGLLDVVGAMRSLAGMRLQQAQRSLRAARQYADDLSAAIAAAVGMIPEVPPAKPRGKTGRILLLFAAEHGFVGGFNEHLLEAAEKTLSEGDELFILGARGAATAAERGAHAAWIEPMPTRPENAPDTIQRLAAELYRRLASGQIARVETIHARYRPAHSPSIEHDTVVPLDLGSYAGRSKGGGAPLRNLEAQVLLEQLTAEYVFALLTAFAIESLASENAARFSTMDAAHENIGRKLDELREMARRVRQSEITTELLDVVTGAEALGDDRTGRRD